MDDHLERELIEAYPMLYDHDAAPSYGTTDFPIECDDGWYPLVDGVSAAVSAYAETWDEEIRFVQVKQKFGELRIYAKPSPASVTAMIALATELSTRTCERCSRMAGAAVRDDDGWYRTLCNSCWEESES